MTPAFDAAVSECVRLRLPYRYRVVSWVNGPALLLEFGDRFDFSLGPVLDADVDRAVALVRSALAIRGVGSRFQRREDA